MTAGIELQADFAAEGGAPAGDNMVRRTAKVIFRAGRYEFADAEPYQMTADDIRAAVAEFKEPVPIDDNHRPTTLANGKPAPPSFVAQLPGGLGRVTKLVPSDDYLRFGGEVELPRWLHDLTGGKPIALSATWDRATKRLKNVALTHNPRIPDAALFTDEEMLAAFAKAETATLEKTPHGQKMMQFIHDHAAVHGAVCSGGAAVRDAAAFVAQEGAAFTAGHELSSLQKIHDMTLGSGAKCAIYREGMGQNKEWRPGQYYDTAVSMIPRFKDYHPGMYASMSADAAPSVADALATFRANPPVPGPAGTDLAPFLAEAAKAATPVPAPQPTARERELEAKLAASEAKERQARHASILSDAVAFTAGLGGKLTPDLRTRAVSLLRAVAADDHDHGAATFSGDDGRPRPSARASELKAFLAALSDLPLTREMVPGDHAVLFAQQTTLTAEEQEAEDVKRRTAEYAEKQNKLNGRTALKRG